ncbi:MAG: PQQ-binding-like beta-propeller repeat protein [Spirochaetota bacterium]
MKLGLGLPRRGSGIIRTLLATFGFFLIAGLAVFVVAAFPFGRYDFLPDTATASPAGSGAGSTTAVFHLDPTSPWPKFRANALQTGRSAVKPTEAHLSDGSPGTRPWTFPTGKGIFSSPVIDGEGTVYIGSADGNFYALARDGGLKWKIATAGIIDSSALLDDSGNVFFGAGDGLFYCADRVTGKVKWTFAAQGPAEMKKEFGVELHNVSWFEGNAGMLPDGSILAPNDNHLVYVLDRDSGKRKTQYLGNEMVWSLPAINAATGRLFFGSDFIAINNVFAFDIRGGKPLWTAGGLGTIAATPLLTSASARGALVLGGFDGYLRAFAQDSGKQLWSFGTRDHIYASAAQLSDGTLIQPSADGTVYAVDPRTGRQKWAFDTLEPIRSSPAVDGNDRIYVGTGDGRLVCLESDGRLRWSYRCIDGSRDDLNASPALGPEGIVVAGESGGIFFVPWDWPLLETGKAAANAGGANAGAATGAATGAASGAASGNDGAATVAVGGEGIPDEGTYLLWTGAFGALSPRPPTSIAANQALAFTLLARSGGDTLLSAIDRDSVRVTIGGNPAFALEVGANRRFLTIVPTREWTVPAGGRIELRVEGAWKRDLSRFGLKFSGGRQGGTFRGDFAFDVEPRGAGPAGWTLPARPAGMPVMPGEATTVFRLERLAAPNPSMLPSWNQIGFDSLHYLAYVLGPLPTAEGQAKDSSALAWVIAGKKVPDASGQGSRVVPDPSQALRFPLIVENDGGVLTLHDHKGFSINFVGSWDMPFGSYRLSAGSVPSPEGPFVQAQLAAVALCDRISFYGPFLKLLGMSEFDSGKMAVFGGLELGARKESPSFTSAEVGAMKAAVASKEASVTLSGSGLLKAGHVYSLLLVEAETGLPLPLSYTQKTAVEADAEGILSRVAVSYGKGEVRGPVRLLLLVDGFVAAQASATASIEDPVK